jgi:hypothetical protein
MGRGSTLSTKVGAERRRAGACEWCVENGSLGHGIGLETPGESESQGVKAMDFTSVIAVKGRVEIKPDHVGYVHHREVEGFAWIKIGHGWTLMLSVLEDKTARYSGGFRVMRIGLGVARFAGRALALRAEPRGRIRIAPLVPSGCDR